MSRKKKKSERCIVQDGPFAGRVIMLGWATQHCTVREREADGGLRPYKLRRSGEVAPSGQSYLVVERVGDVQEYRTPPDRPRRRRNTFMEALQRFVEVDEGVTNFAPFAVPRIKSVNYDGIPSIFRHGL